MINNDLIKGTTLYENSSGNTGNVTLSDTYSNYSKLTIIGSDSDNNYFSNDYYYPYNANIYVGTPMTASDFAGVRVAKYSLSGTTMTKVYCSQSYNTASSTGFNTGNQYVKIYKVIGYNK